MVRRQGFYQSVMLYPMKKIATYIGKIALVLFFFGAIYILTLCYPQLFFKNKVTIGNITVYSDEEIPSEINHIVKSAESKIKKSAIYKKGLEQKIFIANNPMRWAYFSNVNNKAGGLAYVFFIHNVFFRRVDIKNNRLYGPSGKVAAGNRTLDYFMAHEITHQLEYQAMPWYTYSIKENWIQEGYSEYIGHDSQNYETALRYYLEVPENSGAKRYTKLRVMVAYLLEKEKISIADMWNKTNDYDSILKKAIPNDKPNSVN